MLVTAKVFGSKLITDENRTGLIMELSPYHKPRLRNLLRFVWNRMWNMFGRTLRIILIVSILFWALSYTPGGDITGSVIYKIGTFMEPVTVWLACAGSCLWRGSRLQRARRGRLAHCHHCL